jgi:hypothetical protein
MERLVGWWHCNGRGFASRLVRADEGLRIAEELRYADVAQLVEQLIRNQ